MIIKKSLIILLFLFFNSCVITNKSKIKQTANKYMEGRINYRSGDSSLLKSVTSDSLFLIIRLNHDYMNLSQVPVHPIDLNIRPRSVDINGDIAKCYMNSSQNYFLNLRNVGDSWIVYSENDNIPNSYQLNDIRMKIAEKQEYIINKLRVDSVNNVVISFRYGVSTYFKSQDDSKLVSFCDTSTLKFVKAFYNYAMKRTGMKLILAEMDKYKYAVGNIYFDEKFAYYQYNREEENIILKKNEYGYTVVGVDNIQSKYFNQEEFNKNYRSILRALGLTPSLRYMSDEIK